MEKFEAVIDCGEHTSSVADLINFCGKPGRSYEFYPGVEDDETLGRIYVEDMEAIDIPDHLLDYFDYKVAIWICGSMRTAAFPTGGQVVGSGSQFVE